MWLVPGLALYTSVQGHAPVAVYDTQPVAGSLVVNVRVALDSPTLPTAMFVSAGGVTSGVDGASGPPVTHAAPLNSVAAFPDPEASAAVTPLPSLNDQAATRPGSPLPTSTIIVDWIWLAVRARFHTRISSSAPSNCCQLGLSRPICNDPVVFSI